MVHVVQVFGFDANSYEDGAVLGCDFAGTVEEVGSDVTRLSKGDVVAGIIWGGKMSCPLTRGR